MAIQDDAKANILALLNASDIDLDGETTIFGMVVKETLIEYGISVGYTYISEMVGEDEILLLQNKNRIVSFLTDATMLRVWATLAGISIPTHFNFKIGDNTISKNVHPMIEMNMKMYGESVKRWVKLLMADSWTKVSEQEDLTFTSPIYNEDYGHDSIRYDSCNI